MYFYRKKICKECKQSFKLEDMAYKGLKKGKRIYRNLCKICDSKSDRVQKKRQKNLQTSRRLRQEFAVYKSTLTCADCGMLFKDVPWLCDFHHLDPTIKDRDVRSISYLVQLNSKEKLKLELEKCIPLCANCHRTRHHFLEDKSVFKKSNLYKKNRV